MNRAWKIAAGLPAAQRIAGNICLPWANAAYDNRRISESTDDGELSGTIKASYRFNDSVMAYNTKRELFPTNLVAGIFQFGPAELFQVDNPSERQAPKVSFS
jgi:hypothetical protein